MSTEFFDVSNLITDEAKEVDGVWKDYARNASVKVGRWGNTAFTRLLRAKFKASRTLLDGEDDLADATSTDIMIEVMAHTILRDVKGFGFAGKAIEQYTPEIGMQLLKVKDFRERVKALSENIDDFLAKKEEALVNV